MSEGATEADSVVVYTAITGDYDSLKRQPRSATEGADFVAFLDAPRPSPTWRVREIHTGFQDAARNAKIHKILPHRYFPQARYSLWIDGSVTIRFPYSVQRLIELYLADCDLAVFRHRTRTCLHQEADVCLRRRLDDPAVVWRQVARYTQEGYPPNAGMAECTVVLRRHTPTIEEFNEAWWEEISTGSRRDQLSFPYAAAKAGLKYGTFPGTLLENPLFYRARHRTPLLSVASELIGRQLARRASGLSAMTRAALISLLSAHGRRPAQDLSGLREFLVLLARGHVGKAARRSRLGGALARVCSSPRARPIDLAPPNRPARPPTPIRGVQRRVVALGPARDVPSWSWVGFDTARELSKYYDVVLYDSWSTPPACDVLLIVKERPPGRFVSAAQRNGSKLVYCPIDAHRDQDHLTREADIFRACHMVLLHSERLLPLVRPYCENTHFVEHHARFATAAMADYKDEGYVLWVGGYQYVPYLLRWLEHHPIEHELRILTNIDNHRSRHAARLFAAEIGMKLPISRDACTAAGYPVLPWSERCQAEMMRDCKASLDVKLTDNFNQYHKPPTKAQQMIVSGIPFAINPESYSADYFRRRGFELASPSDPARWLSWEYWEATRRCGESLRERLSLAAVGSRYRELIDSL